MRQVDEERLIAFGFALDKALSSEFLKSNCRNIDNPYGSGDAAGAIIKVLRAYGSGGGLQKKFYDISGLRELGL